MQYLKLNSGSGAASGVTISIGPCLDSAGAEFTTLAIGELTLTKNGTSAAMAANATLTHTSNGHYDLVTIGNNADTLGRLRIRCNKVGYQIPPLEFMVLPAMIYDSFVAGTDRFDVNVTHVADTAQTPLTIGDSFSSLEGIVNDGFSAVTAKTDALPTDPADASVIAAAFATTDAAIAAIHAKTVNLPSDPADHSILLTAISDSYSSLDGSLSVVNSGIAAVHAKTTNLPSDPADASVIAAEFAITDAAIAAVHAKTTNLPSDPADASVIAASFVVVNQNTDLISDNLNALTNYVSDSETGLPAVLEAIDGIEGGGGGGGPVTLAANSITAAALDPSASAELIAALLATDNGGDTLAEQWQHLDMDVSDVEGGGGSGGSLTDTNHEDVPQSRTWRLVPTIDEGLIGDSERSMMANIETTFAVDFANDAPSSGWISTVDAVDVVAGTGLTISDFGRDHSQAKFRAVAESAGAFQIEVEVTYNSGSSSKGLVVLNVPEPAAAILSGGTPGSSDSIEFTDVEQEPVPTARVFKLTATAEDGMESDIAKSILLGAGPATYAADFANDCPANGRIATVSSVCICEGDESGLTISDLTRERTQAKFRVEPLVAGEYTLAISGVYTSGDGFRGSVRFVVA